ncbi:MAG: response regulator transcription factor [Ignavibacteriaceae bacterium]|nr:response regulator transcription factor [Ignavibacteriaceae bacterium]
MDKQSSNEVLRAIIVDDEFHGRENLKKIIETYCTDVSILAVADSTVEAQLLIKKHLPDVIFLDIHMPVLDGFDLLSEFKERDFLTVIVSAHEKYGIAALKQGAVDYLLKPVNIKELRATIIKLHELKAKRNTSNQTLSQEKIIIPTSHGFTVVHLDDILRFEAEGSYVNVVTLDGRKVIVSKTLKEFEDQLPDSRFFRVHKSHLVNLKFVKEFSHIDGGFIILTNGEKIEVSRRKSAEFLSEIKKYLKHNK